MCTQCCAEAAEEYACLLNLPALVEELMAGGSPADVCVSTDAGLYLCEFTYFTTLSCNPAPALFVHIPPVGQPHSLEVSGLGVSPSRLYGGGQKGPLEL